MTAGLGTRLMPFTGFVSKPLLPVMSVPTLFFTLDQLADAGVNECACNLHAHPEETRDGISAYDRDMNFHWSDETVQILGSWGGVVTASQSFTGKSFYWLNGDVISSASLKELSQVHSKLKESNQNLEITLLLRKSKPGEARYRKIITNDTSGLVTGFGELEEECWFYASQSVVEKSALDSFPKNKSLDFVKDYLSSAIKRGVVGYAKQKDYLWIDIGSPALWAEAHFSLMKLLEEEKLSTSWKERLLGMNEQVSPLLWKTFGLELSDEVSLQSPLYLGVGDYVWTEKTRVGPRAVLYGSEEHEANLENRITFSGVSVQLPKE
ncbi:MAG: hypothetical protein KA715_01370 [Xanthomonadaceae bacterium]|nr:hypothetical protein [Xanthomonadaceae bacterium]